MVITDKYIWRDKEYLLEWLPGDEKLLADHKPVTQAYGICIGDDGLIAIVSENEGRWWTLPGGTVEADETPFQTLEREVMEEADLKLTDIKLLGLQKVTDDEKVYYQARLVSKITEVLPQTIDPAKGKTLVREFVSIKNLNQYLKWGIIGDSIINSI